jgi:uncharacterized protein YkwD
MRRPLALVCVLVALLLTALAPAAHASAADVDRAMLAAINAERTERGLKPVKVMPRLTRSCRSYARRMLSENRWGHAGSSRVKGVGPVAEILGRTPGGRPAVQQVVKLWLGSAVHRRVLLSSRYSKVGIAHRTGRMGGKRTTVWVVRFAR